jgi:hypothetical protein
MDEDDHPITPMFRLQLWLLSVTILPLIISDEEPGGGFD